MSAEFRHCEHAYFVLRFAAARMQNVTAKQLWLVDFLQRASSTVKKKEKKLKINTKETDLHKQTCLFVWFNNPHEYVVFLPIRSSRNTITMCKLLNIMLTCFSCSMCSYEQTANCRTAENAGNPQWRLVSLQD